MWDLVLDWRLPFVQTRLALARTETLPWRTQNITTGKTEKIFYFKKLPDFI
jgi:hypothetical protein